METDIHRGRIPIEHWRGGINKQNRANNIPEARGEAGTDSPLSLKEQIWQHLDLRILHPGTVK